MSDDPGDEAAQRRRFGCRQPAVECCRITLA
jgi:hypothetical protein